MAISPAQYPQLVSAPMLQDYLVDKDTGAPLAGGWVSMFQDTSRTTFKNWYYQVGTPGNYTFQTLDNPLQLSSVGTIQDPNGNDVIPFYYPFNEQNSSEIETYFVQVNTGLSDGSMGAVQFTRENFPFTPSQVTPTTAIDTLDNYIINNEFWRNIGTTTLNSSTFTGTTPTGVVLAPSQHGGFQFPDIQFVKNGNSTDVITFMTFNTDNVLDQSEVTPEYFINVNCTAGGSDTVKYIRIPISLHLKTLSNQVVSISYQALNVGSAANNNITVSIIAETGTGASSAPVENSYVTQIIGGAQWIRYTVPAVLTPAGRNLSVGPGDDGYYLLLGFKTGVGAAGTFNLNIAKPEIYLSETIPNNEFDTYDQVDSIINTPRTGDVRISLNTFEPFGWVPMDDGTIGSSTSNATTRANTDTWQLYSLLWNTFNPGLGMSSPIIPIFTSAGPGVSIPPYTPTTFGATAIADWNAGKKIALTRMLGRMLSGTASTMPVHLSFTNAGANLFTVTAGSLVNVYNGIPITILTYGGVAPPFIGVTYYIKVLSPTTFSLYWDPEDVNIVTGSFGTGSGTAQLPDNTIGQFPGFNFGDTTGTYQASTGYPASVTTGGSAINTRNPQVYLNFFMKL